MPITLTDEQAKVLLIKVWAVSEKMRVVGKAEQRDDYQKFDRHLDESTVLLGEIKAMLTPTEITANRAQYAALLALVDEYAEAIGVFGGQVCCESPPDYAEELRTSVRKAEDLRARIGEQLGENDNDGQ